MYMSCFKCSINLCDILIDCVNNATINTNQPAPITGVYKLVLTFLDIKLVFEKQFNQNENLIFDVTSINEKFCYEFKLMVNDEVLDFNINNKTYNSFNFCTQKWINISL